MFSFLRRYQQYYNIMKLFPRGNTFEFHEPRPLRDNPTMGVVNIPSPKGDPQTLAPLNSLQSHILVRLLCL